MVDEVARDPDGSARSVSSATPAGRTFSLDDVEAFIDARIALYRHKREQWSSWGGGLEVIDDACERADFAIEALEWLKGEFRTGEPLDMSKIKAGGVEANS